MRPTPPLDRSQRTRIIVTQQEHRSYRNRKPDTRSREAATFDLQLPENLARSAGGGGEGWTLAPFCKAVIGVHALW